ncbi:hypothetical protein VitviT2T_011030 [Vitis vinifera]|uniref:Uncharacterized protein n=1 Tax=Vitis vinifera TaxID=29760 RepID=A0ABY9CAC3_VITVI|nr:hypothetical protein VitviT2T_011030 [Vitis vinifera]
MSHMRNSVRPAFYLIRMSHNRNYVRPTSHFLRVYHIRNSSPSTFHPGISHPEFFSTDIPPGYLTSGILSDRRSIFSRYFAVGAYRRVREENDSTSPNRHVRILW